MDFLPTEVLADIFHFFPGRVNHCILSGVCKRFYHHLKRYPVSPLLLYPGLSLDVQKRKSFSVMFNLFNPLSQEIHTLHLTNPTVLSRYPTKSKKMFLYKGESSNEYQLTESEVDAFILKRNVDALRTASISPYTLLYQCYKLMNNFDLFLEILGVRAVEILSPLYVKNENGDDLMISNSLMTLIDYMKNPSSVSEKSVLSMNFNLLVYYDLHNTLSPCCMSIYKANIITLLFYLEGHEIEKGMKYIDLYYKPINYSPPCISSSRGIANLDEIYFIGEMNKFFSLHSALQRRLISIWETEERELLVLIVIFYINKISNSISIESRDAETRDVLLSFPFSLQIFEEMRDTSHFSREHLRHLNSPQSD